MGCTHSANATEMQGQAVPHPSSLKGRYRPPCVQDIWAACRDGKLEEVNRCLTSGSMLLVNTPDPSTHRTPLYVAAVNGHAHIVERLLHLGARDDDGEAFLAASDEKCRRVMEEFLPRSITSSQRYSRSVTSSQRYSRGPMVAHRYGKGRQPYEDDGDDEDLDGPAYIDELRLDETKRDGSLRLRQSMVPETSRGHESYAQSLSTTGSGASDRRPSMKAGRRAAGRKDAMLLVPVPEGAVPGATIYVPTVYGSLRATVPRGAKAGELMNVLKPSGRQPSWQTSDFSGTHTPITEMHLAMLSASGSTQEI